MTIVQTTVDTPAGELCIAVRDRTVVACGFADHFSGLRAAVAARNPEAAWTEGESPAADALHAYVAGDTDALDHLDVDTGGTPFQQQVWAALRTIPAGTTWSYADLADAVGRPRATRAVGSANGANPISVVIPCHRVIRAGGAIGGYGGGLRRKEWLLAHEGVLLTA